MDRLIYTAMTGAKQAMLRQDTLAQNLANANTLGYRAETTAHRSVPIRGAGEGTRVFAVESTPGVDFSNGPIQQTGRDLDVAIDGKGFFVVQGLDGTEAYTRAGSLQMDDTGALVINGRPVQGDGGALTIPPDTKVAIATDGTISTTPESGKRNAGSVVGRLKLVNPAESDLVKGADGLFRMRVGQAEMDDTVRVSPGSVEGSNVNVVEAMVGIIAVARQFEMQMKMLQTAEADSRAAAQLLGSNG